VETFLRDVLDGHHGDHAANYLTANAQFHAGTVGNFTGRATVDAHARTASLAQRTPREGVVGATTPFALLAD
jgi:hypothetical protein